MEFFKDTLPGSIPFLVIIFGVGLILVFGDRTSRLGKVLLCVLFVFYLASSIPFFSRILALPLTYDSLPIKNEAQLSDVHAIVVLDGGTLRYSDGNRTLEFVNRSSALRALEAGRLYHLVENGLVIASGGDDSLGSKWRAEASAIADVLLELGVPASHIILDSYSLNTRDHAVNVTKLLKERGIEKFVLVTSPTHMMRAAKAFRAEANGLDFLQSASPSSLEQDGFQLYFPSENSLLFSQEIWHEYLGMIWYKVRGWI